MPNLELGNTIWLNVSRKLLSFHRYFFTPFEKMPKEIYREFTHHSHTHANSTITCVASTHTHAAGPNGSTDCGSGVAHSHTYTLPAGDSHTHNFTLSYGSANLGNPNWWEHVHSITLSSCTSGGTNHTHSNPSVSNGSRCGVLGCNKAAYNHTHPIATSNNAANDAHTHTVGVASTDNSDSGQTPQSHTHTVLFTCVADTDVVHVTSCGTTNASCPSYNHGHAAFNGNTGTGSHVHSVSGTSGLGGEEPPVTSKMTVQVM